MFKQKFNYKLYAFCYATVILIILCINSITDASSSDKKKKFGEKRVSYDSDLRVQYYDRTAALTEWDDENTLIGCELVSISNISTLNQLSGFITNGDEPKPITFNEILQLTDHCDNLDTPLKKKSVTIFSKQTLNIISGIFPGTKWCGTKNLANNFYDLGLRIELDRCCRKHDFCPVKIRGLETRYNITNTSKYTRLHCKCDELFYNCLKKIDNQSANLVGRTYFNIGKRDCFEESSITINSTNGIQFEFKEPKRSY